MFGTQLRPAVLVRLGKLPGECLSPGLGLIDLELQLAGKLIEVQQFIDVKVDALDPDRVFHGIRIFPDEALVEHVFAPALS
jgi:hypothetical protein